MILVICAAADCGTVIRVMGDADQLVSLVGPKSEYWPDKFKCPRCGGDASASPESWVDPEGMTARHVIELEAQEMFLFQMGMGLPEERDCRPTVIVELFKSMKVKKIKAHMVDSTWRTVIEYLEFEDGTRMYFGASAHGATVYRIVKPIKHTEQVLQETDSD